MHWKEWPVYALPSPFVEHDKKSHRKEAATAGGVTDSEIVSASEVHARILKPGVEIKSIIYPDAIPRPGLEDMYQIGGLMNAAMGMAEAKKVEQQEELERAGVERT